MPHHRLFESEKLFISPLLGDELPSDMRIPLDKQDKLHGCLEHLFNQVCEVLFLHRIAFYFSMSIKKLKVLNCVMNSYFEEGILLRFWGTLQVSIL